MSIFKKLKRAEPTMDPSSERLGSTPKRAGSHVASSGPSGAMIIEVQLDRSDYDPFELGAELALANTVVASELAQGRHSYLVPHLVSWFESNRDTKNSPTVLGAAWYVHQERGRLQLVDADLLSATGLSDPATHPGNNIWSSRVTADLAETGVAHLVDHPKSGPAPVSFAGSEVIAPELPWQAGHAVRSLFGSPISIRMPNPLTPWVTDVSGVTQTGAQFRFANGDEMMFENLFPLFDDRICASGNPARFAQVTLQQGEILAATEAEHLAPASRALAEAVDCGDVNLPNDLRAWLSTDAALAGEQPPTPLGARWRFHQNTGVMELVDRDLWALSLSTGGEDVWGHGCGANLRSAAAEEAHR